MIPTSPPKNAATVILLRSGESGDLEVFLTRRPDKMNFLGGAYVFPGGTVRKEDCSRETLKHCRGISSQEARNILGAHLKPEVALGHWMAGIREVFEEVGVLLCVTESGEPPAVIARLEEKRRKTIRRELSFGEVLETEGLRCDARRLIYFSHWLTPEEFAMRFDTRFFLAVLPPDQVPLEKSEEVAHALWLAPERAMQLYDKGNLPMIFPTYASLRTLADFESFESLVKEYPMTDPSFKELYRPRSL
jgi:8-oxo-dGTP pyrophosphatase MutT (NUDIX family)